MNRTTFIVVSPAENAQVVKHLENHDLTNEVWETILGTTDGRAAMIRRAAKNLETVEIRVESPDDARM